MLTRRFASFQSARRSVGPANRKIDALDVENTFNRQVAGAGK
jgi:hypothetical protein